MVNIFIFIFILVCFFSIELRNAEKELPKLKGIVKTIQGKYDVIDCVDILEQPTFDHPLLKDHKVQNLKFDQLPTHNIKAQSNNASEEPFVTQTRNATEECPEGTIPIKRFEQVDEELLIKMKVGSFDSNVTKLNSKNEPVHEFAISTIDEGTYYGTKFCVTLWNPHVEPNEFSLAQTIITAGPYDAQNAIVVGWAVHPYLYKDCQTRLLAFWTTDGYKTGCFNMNCPGFVQLSRWLFLGAPLLPISEYGSQNYGAQVAVYKCEGNWYLQLNEEVIGYWPGDIFSHLKDSATRVIWGGEILNARNGGRHTLTQMGSGHYGKEKYSKAAAFYSLQVKVRENDPEFQRPEKVYPALVSNENCYSMLRVRYNENFGDHFFYGGPGYSKKCQ